MSNFAKYYESGGTIFDNTTKSSPFYWIQSGKQMGYTPSVIPKNMYDICNNLAGLQLYGQYSNLQFYGTPSAAIVDGTQQSNRYFVNTNTKCFDPKTNNTVDKYYVIDGLANVSGYDGLALSAEASLSNFYSSNINSFYTIKDPNSNVLLLNNQTDPGNNNCVKIQINTDKNGNVDTQYVSFDEWNRISGLGYAKEAFRGGRESHVLGYNGVANNHSVYTTNTTSPLAFRENTPSGDFTHNNVYSRIMSSGQEDNQTSYEESPPKMDIIDGFFLGSITVLGLYIIFRFMEKSDKYRMRR